MVLLEGAVEPQDASRRIAVALWALFLILAIGIGLIGHRYYQGEKREIEREIRNQLSAIADQKVGQLTAWRRERRGDAADPILILAARAALEGKAGGPAGRSLLAWMESAKRHLGYKDAMLVGPNGDMRLALTPATTPCSRSITLAREAMRARKVTLADLHAHGDSGEIHMTLITPVSPDPREPLAGAILLWIDPHEFLYPLIQTWPTPSRTAETLLVRREGNEVVFLNELRHRKNTALALRLPLENARAPAARAVLGHEGLAEGPDYRGVSVLAAVRRVPDAPWFLVAKVDAEEVYAPARYRAWVVILFTGLLIAGVGIGAGLLWRRQRRAAEEERGRLVGQAQEALRVSEARLKDAQRMARLGNWECELLKWPAEPSDEIYWWSEEAYRIFGVDPKTFQVSRESFTALIEPADRERLWAASQRSLATRTPYEVEHWVRRPGGTQIYVREHAEIVCDETGRPRRMIGTVQDITEYKRLEEQFRQAQKLESVGRLAGGVAHDFNNLLTVINGYSDLVLERLDSGHPLRPQIAAIRDAGGRAASLTRQLLAFSRKQIIRPEVLDLSATVANAEDMLRRLIGEDITLVTKFSPSLWPVQADPDQVHQVLMNLAVNARDAMPGGGTLVIETANATLDESHAWAHHPSPSPGAYVLLAVSDDGAGMDEETRSHLFEPFFTTKERGKGTGLGLATVYGIVKQSGGWIWVYSEAGRGTTFKIYFPRVAGPVTVTEAPAPPATLRGSETILVVEDQEEVRKLALESLRTYGYRVMEAANAGEALLLSKRHDGPVNLLLTDVVMPGMSGRELAEQLQPLRPEMKVLFVSGYTDNVITHGVLDSGAAFLAKPFTPETLAAKIREVLGPPERG